MYLKFVPVSVSRDGSMIWHGIALARVSRVSTCLVCVVVQCYEEHVPYGY
jgi:hypothetical protein